MRKLFILFAILAFAESGMAQTWGLGSTSTINGVDKLGAHQNGGRGCTGCHAPHSGARGNGGSAAAGAVAVSDPDSGNLALWGQDLGPLYAQTLAFGANGDFGITLPANFAAAEASPEQEKVLTGVMTCLSCHDGSLAKGAMMTNQSYEQAKGLLPAGLYGPQPIPTLLGAEGGGGTPGNYKNDHPIGPLATLGKVGVASRLTFMALGCGTTTPYDCLLPLSTDTAFMAFYNHYGAFQITGSRPTSFISGGSMRVVMPDSDPAKAYLICTTCHTPHSMYTFSGTVNNATKGYYPTYFFIAAPYNPGSNPTAFQASSATQFCRQCHFTGAGGSNEGSGIMGVTTKY